MINNFKSMIIRRDGLARANRFEVQIVPPNGLQIPTDIRDLNLLCENVSLPGKQITTFEWTMYGHSIKIPTNFIQEDVSCIFNLTNDFYVKKLFDEWQNKVIDPVTFLMNYENVFKGNVKIYQLDENNNRVFGTHLVNAYPVSVQAVVLDNNSEGATQKLSVVFTYDNFVPISQSDLKK